MLAEKLKINERYQIKTTPELPHHPLWCAIFDLIKNAGVYDKVVVDLVIGSTPHIYQWCTKDGKLPKRIAKTIHKLYGISIQPKLLSVFGETLRRHVGDDVIHYIDIVDHFDWHAGDFGDSGSCFWGGRRGAKDMIYDAGGFAMREFTDGSYERGMARCWCIPQEDVYYLFNAYGGVRVEQFAAYLCELTGFESQSVSLYNDGCTGGTLYLNSGHGIAVFPPGKQIDGRHDFLIEDDDSTTCDNCGDVISGEEVYTYNGTPYCESCFDEYYTRCDRCGETYPNEDVHRVIYQNRERWWCEYCAHDHGVYECVECNDWTDSSYLDPNDDHICESCFEDHYTFCEECDTVIEQDEAEELDNRTLCEDCHRIALEKLEEEPVETE